MGGKDDLSAAEKLEAADEGLRAFLSALGGDDDVYKQVFLEVLLTEVYGVRVDLTGLFPRR